MATRQDPTDSPYISGAGNGRYTYKREFPLETGRHIGDRIRQTTDLPISNMDDGRVIAAVNIDSETVLEVAETVERFHQEVGDRFEN